MKTLFLLSALLYANLLPAQIKWLQTGQQWAFCYQLGWTGSIGCDTMTVGGDTIIAGKACKILGENRFAYEISDKVFVYDNVNAFYKIYDFDMIEGETLDIGIFSYQVDSIFTMNLGDFSGVSVQKVHILGDPYRNISTFYIVEGIGMLKTLASEYNDCVCGHLFPIILSCDFNSADGMDTYLKAFSQNSISYFPADTITCPAEEIDTNSPFQGFDVKIQPNPAATTCYINYGLSYPKGNLTLFSYTGVPVRYWQDLPEAIDLSSYPSGFYFLTLHHNDRVIWAGKIVKQ